MRNYSPQGLTKFKARGNSSLVHYRILLLLWFPILIAELTGCNQANPRTGPAPILDVSSTRSASSNEIETKSALKLDSTARGACAGRTDRYYPAFAPKPERASHAAKAAEARGAKSEAVAAPDAASVVGRPLMLNGSSGLLRLSGSGKTLQIDTLKLVGEGVSDSTQKCEVDIVGEKPIEATSVGRPDGLERYEAGVPACPFAFDVLDGAVLVPAQITACVFKAADCQTSPSGLWGPDPTSMDAAEVAKRRTAAEKAMGEALHDLEERAQDNPDAADLLSGQSGFPGQREDQCHAYVKESSIGYCAAVLTEARAAFLESRLAELPPAAKADKSDKKRSAVKRKPKPEAAAAAPKP